MLGLGSRYALVEGKNVLERIEIHYQRDISRTFYRPYRVIQKRLESHGLDVEFISI
jgi:hypothetical protein